MGSLTPAERGNIILLLQGREQEVWQAYALMDAVGVGAAERLAIAADAMAPLFEVIRVSELCAQWREQQVIRDL